MSKNVGGPVSACEGKHPYETMRLAMSVAKRGRNSLHAYRCPFCSKFHIGRSKPV